MKQLLIISQKLGIDVGANTLAKQLPFTTYMYEKPTIRVSERVGSRSKLLNDKENPNCYWGWPNTDKIQVESTKWIL